MHREWGVFDVVSIHASPVLSVQCPALIFESRTAGRERDPFAAVGYVWRCTCPVQKARTSTRRVIDTGFDACAHASGLAVPADRAVGRGCCSCCGGETTSRRPSLRGLARDSSLYLASSVWLARLVGCSRVFACLILASHAQQSHQSGNKLDGQTTCYRSDRLQDRICSSCIFFLLRPGGLVAPSIPL